jgi:hypothetical protein
MLRKTAAVIVIFTSMFLVGCVDDAIYRRALIVNMNLTEYSNDAIFLDIIRSGYREPLTFMSLSQIQGHDTLTGSLGFPTINVGPGQTVAQKLHTFGPNTIGGSMSNDFTMNNIDDQATYAALYSPVAPNSISLLITQGYPRELLFKLLIDHIRVYVPVGGKAPDGSIVKDQPQWFTLSNNPAYEEASDGDVAAADKRGYATKTRTDERSGSIYKVSTTFNLAIDQLVDEGLTIQYRQNVGLYSVGNPTNYRICFDRSSLSAIYGHDRSKQFASLPVVLTDKLGQSGCDSTPWAKLADGTQICPSSPPSQPSSGYCLALDRGGDAEVYFRSVYGAYRFLGEFVPQTWRTAECDSIYTAFDPDSQHSICRGLMEIETGKSSDAFVSVRYGDYNWFVHDGAYNTKSAFAILHQLVQLYSSPSNQPGNTGSVRNAG